MGCGNKGISMSADECEDESEVLLDVKLNN